MTILYDPIVYDRTQSIGSYWETTVAQPAPDPPLNQDQTCDIAIIGGGITGLSAALHLGRDYGIQTQILEAGRPAWGASGRNGGFCCVGSTRLSPEELLHRFGREETHRFCRHQRDAVELVQQLAETERIAIDQQGSGEIEVAHRPSRQRELEAAHAFLTSVAEYDCKLWSPQMLADHGYRSPAAYGALHVGVGFGLNPLKYSLGLAQAARRHGAVIHAHSPVIAWEKAGDWHLLRTAGGTLRAKRVIMATNGYTDDRLHPGVRDRLLPVMSNIITTRPLSPTELEAQGWRTETPIYDTRNLLFYFRLLSDRRLLFGSRGGTRGSAAENNRRREQMTRSFQAFFPAWQDVEISHFWTGLVCLSAALTPHIGHLHEDPSVGYALAYHGNGVAMGTWSGRAIAQLTAGQLPTTALSAVVRQPLRRFPLPHLRIWYLRAMYAAYGVQDALP